MKRIRMLLIFSIAIFLSFTCVFTNSFIFSFSDWVIRTAGVIMMISIAGIVYNTVRMKYGKENR